MCVCTSCTSASPVKQSSSSLLMKCCGLFGLIVSRPLPRSLALSGWHGISRNTHCCSSLCGLIVNTLIVLCVCVYVDGGGGVVMSHIPFSIDITRMGMFGVEGP